jgi:hypothetical protein
MKYKYQVILLGSDLELIKKIKANVSEKISDLQLLLDAFEFIVNDSFTKKYKSNQPSYCIYIGDFFNRESYSKYTTSLLQDCVPILPVFFNDFNSEIPKALEGQNGLEFKDSRIEKISNLILEAFGKLRTTRKVFISYKRTESSSVAIQLYEALEKSNFDVFLDTHSIKQGEPFQEELWHRMSDSDVIILLNTKDFLKSHWCKEEIAEAGVAKIGVLQVVWPGHTLDDMAKVCFPVQLMEKDFRNGEFNSSDESKLENQVVDDLIRQVESLRAGNLASRQNSLISEFINLAGNFNKKITIQPERFLTEKLESGKQRVFIPSVGIPQSININQSEDFLKEIKSKTTEDIFLIYDDLRIRNKWLVHLAWLNKYLDIKTIGKQEFESWLTKN